jgi:hypothetical protein
MGKEPNCAFFPLNACMYLFIPKKSSPKDIGIPYMEFIVPYVNTTLLQL